MFYWLARIGRTNAAKYVGPGICALCSSSYVGYHVFGTPIVRKIFAVYEGPSEKPIPKNLQRLIDDVTERCKGYMWHPAGFDRIVVHTPINWFLSSTLDFLHAGLTESRNGAVIGVPLHFEYESIDDVPDQPITFAKMKLLRDKSDQSKNVNEEDAKLESELNKAMAAHTDNAANIKQTQLKLEKNGEAGTKFAESLVLSDNARRFALARSLFYVDGYRVILNFCSFSLITITAFTMSRFAVMKYNLRQRHVSKRLLVYTVVSSIAAMQVFGIYNIIQTYYDYRADQRAALIDKDFMSGGIEFYSKLINRNKAMRDLIDDPQVKSRFAEDGDINYSLLSLREAPISMRLKELLDLQKAKSDELDKFS